MVGGGDAQNVDAVNESVDDAITALDADDELTTSGGEWVVADGINGVRGGIGVGGGLVGLVVLGCGESEAGLTKGGESNKGSGGWEPLAGLEQDVGSIGGLERER